MNKKLLPVFILCLLLLAIPACSGGGGVSSSLAACIDIEVTSCDLDKYGGYVHGTVINNCTTNVTAVKVIAEVYSAEGLLLASDEEYVQNLAPEEQGTFKAIMDKPAATGKTCKAKIDTAY